MLGLQLFVKNRYMKMIHWHSLKGAGFVLLMSFLLGCSKEELLLDEIDESFGEQPVLDESISPIIPHIYIDIDSGAEVVDKENYLQARIRIEGMGLYPDLGLSEVVGTRIKGRGNSTWERPKKPYRLKLDKKAAVLGLPKEKDWVLLANYQDYTLMTNAVALKIARQLGMPFTNDIIPVDVTINGEYRGNYNLTQQVEVGKNRVDIGDQGILWELDNHFDEAPWQFKTKHLQLPLMLKDPDMDKQTFVKHKQEFQDFEDLLFREDFPENNYGEVFDKQQLVNFLIVANLTKNREICHPKSVFLYKNPTGKFTLGPVWDFDWAFGFDPDNARYFSAVNDPVLADEESREGTQFWQRLLLDPEVQQLYLQTWERYKAAHFEELMQFIEAYAARIRQSKQQDYAMWQVGVQDLGNSKAALKTFLRKRALFMDQNII